jgi:hypothetical protein
MARDWRGVAVVGRCGRWVYPRPAVSPTAPGRSSTMAQTDFSADEERFFQQGEAQENGELPLLDEPQEREPRLPGWRPRIVLVGCVCLALLGLSLAGGGDPPSAAIAAVNFVPTAVSAPRTAPEPPVAPEPAAATTAAPSAPAARPLETRSRKTKKSLRGKRSHQRQRAARR